MMDDTKHDAEAAVVGIPKASRKKRTFVITILLVVVAAVVWFGERPLYMLQSNSSAELLCNGHECFLFVEFAHFGDSGTYGAAAGKLLCAALGGWTPWTHTKSGTIMYRISRSEIARYEAPVGYVNVYGNTLYVAAGSSKWNGRKFELVSRGERKKFDTATDRPMTASFSNYNGWSKRGVGGGSEDSPWSYTVELDGQPTTLLARDTPGRLRTIEVQRAKNPAQIIWSVNTSFHPVSHEQFMSTFGTAFAIAISAPRKRVSCGSDVRLLVTRTNISNRHAIINVADSAGWEQLTFDFDFRDRASNQVAKTTYGRKTERREAPQSRWLGAGLVSGGEDHILKPGDKIEQEILLNKLYDLSKPGKYIVQLEWMDPGSKVILTSNALMLTVTP